jgi:hypothetical protein
MKQFVKVSSVRAGSAAAEMSAMISGLDVFRTSSLLVVAGRSLKSLSMAAQEAAVEFAHSHLTGQELRFVPPSTYTTTSMSAVANNEWAMLY